MVAATPSPPRSRSSGSRSSCSSGLGGAGRGEQGGHEPHSDPAAAGVLFRRRFGRLIWRAGADVGLDTVTAATACLYFQRFFLVEQEGSTPFDSVRIAMACLWLATKVCEEGHSLRDIANAVMAMEEQAKEAKTLQMEAYWALRDELVSHEQAILRAMTFDTEPTMAYSLLTELAWSLCLGPSDRGLVVLAWSLLNDAFCSEVCALASHRRLAAACLLLAAELGRRTPELRSAAERLAVQLERLREEPRLEDFFGLGPESGAVEVEDICRDLLAVYETAEGGRHLAGLRSPSSDDL